MQRSRRRRYSIRTAVQVLEPRWLLTFAVDDWGVRFSDGREIWNESAPSSQGTSIELEYLPSGELNIATILISGKGFNSTTEFSWGSQIEDDGTFQSEMWQTQLVSPERLQVTVPDHPGTVRIGSNNLSVSQRSPESITVFSTNFTVEVYNPHPHLTDIRLSPSNPNVTQAFTLTVSGDNLLEGAGAVLKDQNGQFWKLPEPTDLTTTSMTIDFPADWVTSHTNLTGVENGIVFIDNPKTGAASEPGKIAGFTVRAPQPEITGLSRPLQAGDSSLNMLVEGNQFFPGAVVSVKKEGTTTFEPRETRYLDQGQLQVTLHPEDFFPWGFVGTIRVQNPAPAQQGGYSAEFFLASNIPTPVVSSLSPSGLSAGSADFVLTVTGDHFLPSSYLLFDGNAIGQEAGATGTSLSFIIPANLVASEHTAQLKIITATNGTHVESPTISLPVGGIGGLNSVSPESTLIHQPGGVYLSLSGDHFSAFIENDAYRSPVVLWNGQPLGTTSYSSTSISAFVPENLLNEAGTVLITVQNPVVGGGVEVLGPLTFTVNNPKPDLSLQGFSNMVAGEDYQLIIRSRTELVTGAAVDFNGATYLGPITSGVDQNQQSYYQLLVTIPAAEIPNPPGSAAFTVRNPLPNAGSVTTSVTVLAPQPTISNLVPEFLTTAQGDVPLVIHGDHFLPGVTTVWSGFSFPSVDPIKSFTVISSTQINLMIDGSLLPSTDELLVIGIGSANAGTSTTVAVHNPVPALISVSPGSAHGPGQTDSAYEIPPQYLTLRGSNFSENAYVLANDTPLSTQRTSSTELVIYHGELPHQPGSVTLKVVNPGPGGGTSNPVYFRVLAPVAKLDVINSEPVTPMLVLAGTEMDFPLTVHGWDFLPEATILWDGVPLETTRISGTQLQAVMTAGLTRLPAEVAITVINGDGVPATGSATVRIIANTPSLYSVTPAQIIPGQGPLTVELRGKFFLPGLVASFAGEERPTHYIDGSHATVDLTSADVANQGTFSIYVRNPGTGETGQFFSIVYPPPVLTSVNPPTVPAGIVGPAQQFEISVTGSYFTQPPVYVLAIPQDGSNVAFQLNTVVDDASHLRAQVPGDLLVNAGTIKLQVIEPNAFNGGQSGLLDWIVVAPLTPTVQFALAEQQANEGTTANVIVTLSSPLATPATVRINVQGGTARSGSDYSLNSMMITFQPRETQQTVPVVLPDDRVNDGEKTLALVLVDPHGAIVGTTATTTLTIRDISPPPQFLISDFSTKEGNSGVKEVKLKVALSAASTRAITIQYATADGTATAGQDYNATQGQITFQPGEKKKVISIPIRGDVLDEANETFRLLLTINDVSLVDLGDAQAVGTIVDNDKPPTVSIGNIQVQEGSNGVSEAVFTVTLSAASGQQIAVAFSTVNGTATSPADYSSTTGTVVFQPGTSLTRTITILIIGDTEHEDNETFFVQLGQLTNVTLAKGGNRGKALATILNDD